MDTIVILGIAVGLGMDAFAVAIVVGCRLERLHPRQIFRLSFHFGLFQFLMPVIGWFAGKQVAGYIHEYDHWVAFGLLFIIGGKMIYESFDSDINLRVTSDPTRKWSLVGLSVATSIDALAVGISYAMLNVKILYPSILIGIVAALMTLAGMFMGRVLSVGFGKKMEIIGGLVLIAIGFKILVEHGVINL
ncbi:MAG: manganese efflux pump [candidate division Zixibacteria bacterium]|nr:manganese efflux pump [candidate division Zixibacteria bacterium]